MQASDAIVLKPLSHPDLGELRVDKLLAIGRAEQPFASYARELVIDLSRQHARIYRANRAVYVADLGSKNGTLVNRVAIGDKPRTLQNGDEICFGGALTYRVELPVEASASLTTIVLGVTLTPERSDLHPLVINRFPYLVSKVDEAFARYQQERPEQLHYLSRRHAHIFLKAGLPYIEDLGSTNGTSVDGVRLEGNAVELQDGALLAFGGDYFAYRVRVDKVSDIEPTVIRPVDASASIVAPAAVVTVSGAAVNAAAPLLPSAPAEVATPAPALPIVDAEIAAAVAAVQPAGQPLPASEESAPIDRTTFVAAPNSFLEIFCVDQPKRVAEEAIDEADESAAARASVGQERELVRPRSRTSIFLSEMRQAFAANEEDGSRRTLWIGMAIVAVLVAIAVGLYLWGASERELKNLMAEGAYGKAAVLASERLQREADNSELKAIATEAALKAHVPVWHKLLERRDFTGAAAELAKLKDLGRSNNDLNALLGGLDWIARLDKLLADRGGVDAPIRIHADEDAIRDLLKRWNDDAQGHQRALGRVASHVREFRAPYAEALTRLRKLQSDALVHLAAIERLKALIRAELDRDTPDALQAVLQEYAEKYPKLGGLDAIRADLRQYVELEAQARAGNLARLVVLLDKSRFATPAFADKFAALKASDRFPTAQIVEQYQAVSRAWRAGDTRQAFAGLQAMAAGQWGESAVRELARKKALTEQFAALQKARGGAGYDDRLLAFYGALDLDDDLHFVRAVEAEVNAGKAKALARAQEMLNRSRGIWQRYRDSGGIDGRQRLEAGISERYRAQAGLLTEAYELTRKGVQIYAQLHLAAPTQWSKAQDEIKAELELQRKSLVEVRSVVEPGLLKAKLALLGGATDDARKPI